MILNAGTSLEAAAGKEKVLSDVRQTVSDTQAREENQTLQSAHTNTHTALLNQIAALQQQLMETEAQKEKFKA